MNEYRGEGQWTYLKKVARNIAYNELRERKAQKRAGDVESFEALPDPDSSLITYETPEIELEQRERAERLVAAIERLQPKTQECLLLWLNGATYEEIAEILSLTLSAVKTRLRDARKTLVTRVNDEIS
jgi:RNA polymerase sigma-70 factor (ECF subfamily)